MTDFKLTEDFDLDFGEGDSDLLDLQIETDEKNIIKQQLVTALRSFTNDWFANLDDGLPYFQDILVKNPDRITVIGLYRSAILSVDGVVGVEDFDYDFDASARELTVSFTVLTGTGNIEINDLPIL